MTLGDHIENAFHAMALSLDQHEQQRRQFLADVAHELRTPLTIIQGRLEAILDGVIEPTPEEVAALHSQALLMGRLVHDLEMLALAQAKALTLHMEEVDPVTLASEALQGDQPLMTTDVKMCRCSVAPEEDEQLLTVRARSGGWCAWLCLCVCERIDSLVFGDCADRDDWRMCETTKL